MQQICHLTKVEPNAQHALAVVNESIPCFLGMLITEKLFGAPAHEIYYITPKITLCSVTGV